MVALARTEYREYKNMKDNLTEINDRISFIKLLNAAVHKANEQHGKVALLLIHVNRMQRINTIYNYKIGDQVLKYIADKLFDAKRAQDFVGRLSGTTFGMCIVGVMNKGHAELAARKILRLLEIPLELEDNRIALDISISISLCPNHSSITSGLLKKAEAAMTLAREQGSDLVISEDYHTDDISEFWDIELGIEQAIVNSEFELYYQPKVSLRTGLPSGAEALIRWPHPDRGMIYPDIFIPVAEDHGHIKPMTSWILNVALRETGQWPDKWGKLSISVNIPPDLMDAELVDLTENALNIWHPENVTLVLEILERSFALTNESSFSLFQQLQDLGAQISIDDFGTGYSALSYFKSIPARELKIDRSFVMDMTTNSQNRAVVEFIIKLAHAFNMRVVAEGVEDVQTMGLLKQMGCDYIQGYILSKAMPHQQFLHWLQNYSLADQAYGKLYNCSTIHSASTPEINAASVQKNADDSVEAALEDEFDLASILPDSQEHPANKRNHSKE